MILDDGSKMVIEKIYPLDAVFDTKADVPEDVLSNKRRAGPLSLAALPQHQRRHRHDTLGHEPRQPSGPS